MRGTAPKPGLTDALADATVRVESLSTVTFQGAGLDQTRRSVGTDREAAPAALPPPLDAALGRLAAAVARLKTAGERHAGSSRPGAAGEPALGPVQEDRPALTLELEAALARVERLSQAQAAALERLSRAEASVEAVLRDLSVEHDAGEPPIEEAS